MKKELRDWLLIILTFGLLYVTGAYTHVAAFTQRMVLSTGIITADTEMPEEDKVPAEYDFKLYDMAGDEMDFSDLKGKVIFMNFWASWCAPCLAEMPSIQKLYEEVEDNEDLVFVMVSLDRDQEKAKKYIRKKDYSIPVYFPDYKGLMPKVYESPSIPTTFIISKDGVIDSKKVGMANYNTKKFKKYLNKLINS